MNQESRGEATSGNLWRLAFAGVVSVLAAVGVGELAAGLIAGIPSPILAIGRGVVALQPPGAKDFVASLFGTNDKLALEIVIIAVALAIGAAFGILLSRRRDLAAIVIAGFAGVGFVASLGDPDVSLVLAAGAAGAEAIAGIWVFNRLINLALGLESSRVTRAKRGATMPDWSRRALLVQGGAVAVGSVVGSVVGRLLLEGQRKPVAVGGLPQPGQTVSLPNGADLGIPGETPIVMPNDRFYRIDTALITPNVRSTCLSSLCRSVQKRRALPTQCGTDTAATASFILNVSARYGVRIVPMPNPLMAEIEPAKNATIASARRDRVTRCAPAYAPSHDLRRATAAW